MLKRKIADMYNTNILKFLMICTFFVCSVSCGASKIGVVDPIRLFQESAPGKAGMEHLKSLEDSMQEQIEKAETLMDKSPKDTKLESCFQKMFMEYQQVVNVEQQKVVDIVNDVIQKVLDDYRVANGYSVLMSKDSLLSYNSVDDVTDAIITKLNHSEIKFDPIFLDKSIEKEQKDSQN